MLIVQFLTPITPFHCGELLHLLKKKLVNQSCNLYFVADTSTGNNKQPTTRTDFSIVFRMMYYEDHTTFTYYTVVVVLKYYNVQYKNCKYNKQHI